MIRKLTKRTFSSYVNKFSKLGLRDGLCDAMSNLNFEIPTAIQEVAVPRILENDVVIAAETDRVKRFRICFQGRDCEKSRG